MTMQQTVPVVITLSGNDPTGGAGIQADIEALASMGCHAAPVVTAITVQDSQSVKAYVPLDSDLIIAQARAILEDMPIACIKLGLLTNVETVEVMHSLLMDYPDIPVVMEPVLVPSASRALTDDGIAEAMSTLLFPLVTVLTPDHAEARQLAPEADTIDACGMALLDRGCEFVLVTGTHENAAEITNTLYGNHRILESFTWQRIEGAFHGAGCTLASGIAGLLAQGLEPFTAIHEAQEYTWESLKRGYRIGMGRHFPNRLFWARSEEEESE